MEYGLSYFAMSLDRYIQTFSVTVPVPPTASIGLSLFMSGTDDIQGTDYNGQYTDTYKSWEGYGMLSFGLEFTKLSAGINIKILKNYSRMDVSLLMQTVPPQRVYLPRVFLVG